MTVDLGVAPGTVLVVDDDEDHLLVLAHQLRNQGHRVRTLSSPHQAVGVVAEMRPDVVLLDHRMPGLSGLELCRMLRADPANEFLPVILLSNDASIEVTAAAGAAGVNDFLEKSSPVEMLRLRIMAALRTKRLADLAARRYEEQAFLARLTEDLANSLEEDAILATAATAYARFNAAALYVVLLSEHERPQLLSFGADPVENDHERLDTLLTLAQGALRTNLDPDEVGLQHLPAEWPASTGRPLVHRTLRANPRPRAWLALEATRPLDDDALRLFDAVTDRLAAPLENARLYARVTAAHEQIAETLQKLRQAQASLVHNEKMASIGQLAAGVAHEINNPLAFVISNLNVLREYARDLGHIVRFYRREMRPDSAHPSTLDPEFLISDLESLISESLEGSNRVHGIVKNLKSFAHNGTGHYEEVEVQSAVESTLNLLGGELKQRCVVYRDIQNVSSVRGDRGKLNQVFLNLIVNASEAIPATREGRLWVRLFMDHSEVVFQVEDNGTGIPPAVRDKIFEPFFTTKGIGRGTGLGLAISDEIIRQHGGSISVDTEEGRGTTFTVRLPARDTRPIPTVELHGPPEDANAVAVFIDDERFLLNAFRRAFKSTAQVKVAQGGEEGIRLLEDTPEVDVIFCDLLMPRISGMEVYQWVCDHRPELIDRFVILTAGANDDKYQEFLQSTQLPVIYKPFAVHEVQETINRHVRRPRAGRSLPPHQ
jgi:signal transduction histidine kinase/DNA-binding response OmpR family regulator